jgi:hypothetical protein
MIGEPSSSLLPTRRAIWVGLLLAIGLFLVTVAPALAGGPGNGRGGGSNGKTEAPPPQISAPSSVTVATPFTVGGSGFGSSTAVWVNATSATYIASFLIETDAGGAFEFVWSIANPGDYTLDACQWDKKRGGHWVCGLAPTSLSVQ